MRRYPNAAAWLDHIRQRLQPGSETASLDAQVLLAHVLGRPRTWVLSHPEAELNDEQERVLESALGRLESGEPLPYVLGYWGFYGLTFALSPQVLIPRPETEILVDEALEWLSSHPGRRRAADVGAGSGCISVALARNVPDLLVLACDVSAGALQIAWRNVRRHGLVDRLVCVQANLLPAAGRSLDLVCANLPYIPTGELQSLPVSRYEPWSALDGGPDGLDHIRRLLAVAPQLLAEEGLLLLEIGASQGAAIMKMARECFPGGDVSVLRDLAGHDRLLRVENTVS